MFFDVIFTFNYDVRKFDYDAETRIKKRGQASENWTSGQGKNIWQLPHLVLKLFKFDGCLLHINIRKK